MTIPLGLREYHLPFMEIALIIGFQISMYLFYLYYKYRKENLPLNKILLALGLLYEIGLYGVVIRVIATYYFEDIQEIEFFTFLTHLMISCAILSFLIIISLKDFHNIMNTKITKIILIIATITTILIVVIQDVVINRMIIFISIFIGIIFLVKFHLNLINRSAGTIRKRLIFITLGNFILLSAILIESQEVLTFFSQNIQTIWILFTGLLLIIGLSIVFLGIYRFPAFLEFDWQKSLESLFIIDQHTHKKLYAFDFSTILREFEAMKQQSNTNQHRELLLSTGISGIEDIITILTKVQDKKIDKIQHGKLIILLIYGNEQFSNIIYALLVKKEMNSIKYFLNLVKNQFESDYKDILLNLNDLRGSEELLFKSFDTTIKNLIK